MAADGGGVRVQIRVTPGARRPGVGGEHDGDLVVRVAARAVDGRATEAALAALSDALGVPRRSTRLVRGATSRRKLIEVDGDPVALTARLDALRGAGGAEP